MAGAEDKGVSGWSNCPSCNFLISPDAPRCQFCGADLARAVPTPAGYSHLRGSLPPPPPPPPSARPSLPLQPGVAPFAPPPSSGKRTALSIVIVGVTLVVAVVAALFVFGRSGDDRYPEAWDPRIAPLAEFVADERGLLFEHPVYVDFLDKAAFDEDMTADTGPTEEEQQELDQYAGLYRAFGLMSGDIDLFETGNELMSDGVAAYYSPETKRITVNGDTLDAATRITVVHELTHALQDQHFDLLTLQGELDDVTSETFTAIIEGDATRVENAYYAELSDEELDEVDAAYEVDSAEADYGRFPRVIVAQFGAPYALGEPLVTALAEDRGPSAVDDAIETPPASTEQMLDPLAYLDGDLPVAVPEPEVAADEEVFESGTLGALLMYLVLNERMDGKVALAAADGWSGDAYVAFTRDGVTCVRADILAEDAAALERLSQAVATWAAGMPAGSVQYTVDDDLSLESCDPGAEASIPAPFAPDVDPLLVPSVRAGILASTLIDTTLENAICFTDRYFGGLTVAQLAAPYEDVQAEVEALAAASVAACGG
jgi:hypothetical protein